MKEIPLTKGASALVDDDDFEYLSKLSWYLDVGGYAVNKTNKIRFMHRVIANPPKGMFTDHINGNKLDNRKENLRNCTHTQNMENRGKQKNNTSGYKGVFWSIRARKWRAQITVRRKAFHIGLFDTPEEAALAYNEKAKEIHGEFAYLNNVP